MAAPFPYTYIACPCTPLTPHTAATSSQRRSSRQLTLDQGADGGDDTFNPHDPRANFVLYPYDHLLYCDECHQIRCPRCWTEEIMNWYCPSCLFEVPSSVVKSDGNRCTRNCYNCPLCTAPLAINGLEQKDHLSPQDANQSSGPSGPFFLSCLHCHWTSLDVGIQFSKPTKITEQLAKLRRGNRPAPSRSRSSLAPVDALVASEPDGIPAQSQSSAMGPEDKFANLTNFFKTQLSEASGGGGASYGGSGSFDSPNNLARIMSLYGGLNYTSLKKSREKPQPMREALSPSEGLQLLSPEKDEKAIIKLASEGYMSTATAHHQTTHPYNHDTHFVDQLWPVPSLLRTRRSKRCKTCRHILTKPESKIGSTRYKIRLLAQNNIPRLALRLFAPNASASAAPSPSFSLTSAALQAHKDSEYERLHPLLPVQFLLTLTNPLFDAVKVTLATPASTPGSVASRVTILCPTFEVGAAGDLWDEALNGNGSGAGTVAAASGSGSGAGTGTGAAGAATSTSGSASAAASQRPGSSRSAGGEEKQAEAGKVWERGRNWTSVVVEVVPGTLPVRKRDGGAASTGGHLPEGDSNNNSGGGTGGSGNAKKRAERGVDEDVLEIPVFVRLEWETEVTAEDAAASGATKGSKESRELAFWSVLGAGRIVDAHFSFA